MGDLDRLIALIENGLGFRSDIWDRAWSSFGSRNRVSWVVKAWDDDMNAAKKLQDSLLPGHYLSLTNELGEWKAFVAVNRMGQLGQSPNSPARAWLLAILKAYRSTLT